ncbi:hypothetical protein [Mycobacterium sp. 1245111.1]|uniref:hypothetical protein n=1 Tax=Mycobacterium sp. 1245111.1 TaxID=1834073 RepID=UPI000B26FF29|nr:hypothetical protein [Mycobacterium sp. 1245111.1]
MHDTLVPLLKSRTSERVCILPKWEESTPTTFIPLLETSDGNALAAIYRHPYIAEVWWLPIERPDGEVFDFGAWITAALEAWHEQEPERFPGPADWARSKEWMTNEELQLQAVVEEAQAELERQQAALLEKVSAAESELADAQARHDEGERVLLTGQSAVLVDAVHSMLERLGFGVEDIDKKRAAEDLAKGGKPRPKLEDLRVSDPDSSWVALAEVKGYTGGGKAGDFGKIGRFVGLYQARNDDELPDATWYVVNQFLDRAPDRRPLLMELQAEDVDMFVDNFNGVLVDTRDLFVLDRRVARGEVSAADARALLMNAERRFTLDAEDPRRGPRR